LRKLITAGRGNGIDIYAGTSGSRRAAGPRRSSRYAEQASKLLI
jgi:hypothetical protein